jgi:hypothetical protein
METPGTLLALGGVVAEEVHQRLGGGLVRHPRGTELFDALRVLKLLRPQLPGVAAGQLPVSVRV